MIQGEKGLGVGEGVAITVTVVPVLVASNVVTVRKHRVGVGLGSLEQSGREGRKNGYSVSAQLSSFECNLDIVLSVHFGRQLFGAGQTGVMVLGLRDTFTALLISHQ